MHASRWTYFWILMKWCVKSTKGYFPGTRRTCNRSEYKASLCALRDKIWRVVSCLRPDFLFRRNGMFSETIHTKRERRASFRARGGRGVTEPFCIFGGCNSRLLSAGQLGLARLRRPHQVPFGRVPTSRIRVVRRQTLSVI